MAASKQKQLSNNNLIIVMVLITLLVLGVTAFVVKALVGDISLNAKVIGLKSKADSQVKQDVAAAPNLVDAYNNLGASEQVLADALPTTIDFPALIVEMENIANDAGVNLKSVAPLTVGTAGASDSASAPTTSGPTTTTTTSTGSSSAAVSAPAPQTYPFSIQVEGTYGSLLKVFSDLEFSARPMHVIGIQITGSGSSMSAEVDMDTYYQDAATLPFGTEGVR